MILDPDVYQCPTHDTDLTMLVREQLEDDDAAVAFGRRDRLAGRKSSGARAFAVIVSCPGTDTPHKLTCRGTLTP